MTKYISRNIALAGALTALLGSSAALAQSPRYYPQVANRNYANRTVEGTVASVSVDRGGREHLRLTNGMDLVIPSSVMWSNQGQRYAASRLQPGDVVRMDVYSRQGDGRDAQVRSLTVVQSRSGYGHNNGAYNNGSYNNNNNNNGRYGSGAYDNGQVNGTVLSVDRRAQLLVMQSDDGRRVTVDLNRTADSRVRGLRRGDRVSVTGRVDSSGNITADSINR
jgi:hypothetical protein